MLKSGILNPAILDLLGRFRHTNTIVVADRGFPFWPQVPTVDISLIDDIPTVRQAQSAIVPLCKIGAAWMATEFAHQNPAGIREEYASLLAPVVIAGESHVVFKQRIPAAIGLIRTGDTTQYGNVVLESA